MPYMCFSCPPNTSPGTKTRGDTPIRMPHSCFSYPAETSPDAGNRDAGTPVLPGLRQMPAGTSFRY